MARIHHLQYMRKRYGGSETLIETIAKRSHHQHSIGYAQNSSVTDNPIKPFQKVLMDFEDYCRTLRSSSQDLVHAHFVFPGYYAQNNGLNVVCSSHCLFSEEFVLATKDSSNDGEISDLLEASSEYRKIECLFYPQIRHLVVHSEFHKRELERLGCNPKLLELPIDLALYDLDLTKEEARAIIGLPNRFTLLFLGRPTYLKGFSVLADAFRMIPKEEQCQLLVVGDFKFEDGNLMYQPCVNARQSTDNTVSMRVGENVFVKPPTPNKLIQLYYLAADVLICPSLYEAIGYVNLEAMATGAVPIGSDSTGIPYVIKDGQNGLLFKSGDHKSLCEKILLARTNPSLRASLTRNAKDFVRQFDVSAVTPKYEAMYNERLALR